MEFFPTPAPPGLYGRPAPLTALFCFVLFPVQSFPTLEEANAFLTGSKPPSSRGVTVVESEHSRFYGVQRGRVPGVYSDWAKAQEQIRGFTRPRYKRFSTRSEAEEFVRLGGETSLPPSAIRFASPPRPQGPPGMMADNPRDENGHEQEAGTGPLPPTAEDGFDPNVLLDPKTGQVVYKTKEQKTATKAQPTGPPGMLRIYTDGSSLRNGTKIASAGVGVYFGPEDSRYVSRPQGGEVFVCSALLYPCLPNTLYPQQECFGTT